MQFSTFAIKYLRKNKNVPINLFFRSYGALVKSFKQKNRRKAHDTPSHEILENLITSPKWTDELGTENLKSVKNSFLSPTIYWVSYFIKYGTVQYNNIGGDCRADDVVAASRSDSLASTCSCWPLGCAGARAAAFVLCSCWPQGMQESQLRLMWGKLWVRPHSTEKSKLFCQVFMALAEF